MQSHQSISSSSFDTPLYPETQPLLQVAPKLMKDKFCERRPKFQFNHDIPEFLFIPNLNPEESEVPRRHINLKPRKVEATKYIPSEMDPNKLVQHPAAATRIVKSKSNTIEEIGSRKQTNTMKNSDSPIQMCARSA